MVNLIKPGENFIFFLLEWFWIVFHLFLKKTSKNQSGNKRNPVLESKQLSSRIFILLKKCFISRTYSNVGLYLFIFVVIF